MARGRRKGSYRDSHTPTACRERPERAPGSSCRQLGRPPEREPARQGDRPGRRPARNDGAACPDRHGATACRRLELGPLLAAGCTGDWCGLCRLVLAPGVATAEAIRGLAASMSARLGRIRLRPDESGRHFRPVDGNRDVSPARLGRKTRIARACAVGGAIVCGLVLPATAHAADPFGTPQIAQQVDAAVAEATAMVPQASGSAVPPVSSKKTLEAATKSLEVATKQAAALASNAVAEAQRETQSAAGASVPAVSGDVARPTVKAHRRTTGHRARTARRSSAPQSALRPRSSLFAATDGGAARLLASPSAAPMGRPQNSGAPASRVTPKPTRPSLPQRPPPLPLPPQPGSALAGQAGGNGPLTPLVVGALAAVLLMMAFDFLPRALPQKAFRKPRPIALLPWHPG